MLQQTNYICQKKRRKKRYNLKRKSISREIKVYETARIEDHIITLDEVLNSWLNNNKIRLKGATVTKYRYLIDSQISPYIGNLPIKSLTSIDINDFLNKKLKGGRLADQRELSSSYVKSMAIIINAAIKSAVSEKLCDSLQSPIYKPQCTKKEITVISPEIQHQLEEEIYKNFDLTKVGILLSLYAGLRIGEVCALSWDDIDMNRKVISISHTVARIKTEDSTRTKLVLDRPKTNASLRTIPITSSLYAILKKAQTISSRGFVISGTDNFINPRTFDYRYHKILEEIGIESFNFHTFRHTFATRCVEAGVDIKSLTEILGHGNVSTTLNTYVHSSIESKRTQLEKLTFVSI